ncbi:hypothetical protein EAH74_11125 [Pseudomonas mandelii]|uniref:Uncharacterized protein n=1 Tax=Pseudomonas mandelii TaxID=75612 RepID=A0A502IGJ8_9PSED|nr:hypothetical protein EAH74_11125 [Pseudomonas mandelii]
MMMPDERSRAVVQTREFLVELSRDNSPPDRVRRDAKFLLRHFPTRDDVALACTGHCFEFFFSSRRGQPIVKLMWPDPVIAAFFKVVVASTV